MKTENQENNDNQSGIQRSSVVSGNRRKLIRGGAIGVPVVLALKSTPVLACNCKLPSGFSTSGNLSRNGGATCQSPANGPSYWQTNLNDAKTKFKGTNGVLVTTPFNSVFVGTDTTAFLSILSGNTFASLVVAAYLDIKASAFSNTNTGVALASIQDVQQMWAGTYQPPGSTQRWSLIQGENYLRYVMGL